MTGYGKVDIIWLDGGWVAPENRDQDIKMDRIVEMARGYQPGLIVVDRWIGGKYENYRTPEQKIPEKPWDYPWETCMTWQISGLIYREININQPGNWYIISWILLVKEKFLAKRGRGW